MKYAVISDIHANLPAWKAVLLDIRSSGVDRIICLGDMVGYGPQPLEVLESLYASVDFFVLGNHDAALCGKIDPELFTDPAREIIHWTSKQLGDSARNFMERLPLSLAGNGFRCAHANFDQPADFHYVFDPHDALPGWQAVPEPLLFIGHTHQPGIFIIGQSQTPRFIPPEDFMLEEGKRFLLNVGSVGQPRDGDARATYCIFDSDTQSVFWRKIPFDLDAYRDALERSGLPENAAPFLTADPLTQQQPLRERVNFSPPAAPAPAMRDTILVQNLDTLKRRVRRWQVMFTALFLMIIIATSIAGWRWMHYKQRRLTLPGLHMNVVRGADLAPESNFLNLPEGTSPPGEPLPYWDIRVDNRYRQQIAWLETQEGRQAFEFTSDDRRAECWLVSPIIHVNQNMRLRMQAMMKKSDDFEGSIALVLELTRRIGDGFGQDGQPEFDVTHNFRVKEPSLKRADNWWLAQQTFDLPARTHSVRLKIGGKFKGTALVSDARLESPR